MRTLIGTAVGLAAAPLLTGTVLAAQIQTGVISVKALDDLITNSNVQAGGPMLKNKLFYFGSLNYQATHVRVAGFPAVVPPCITTRFSLKSQQPRQFVGARATSLDRWRGRSPGAANLATARR
jgi:hypothetical protein